MRRAPAPVGAPRIGLRGGRRYHSAMLAAAPAEISAGAGFLAIPLITLQALVEVAVGGFVAMFITDLTRRVTRGFIGSTGAVLLVVGAIGVAGLYFLPDPEHLTDHPVNHGWITPSFRLSLAFLGLFMLYLVAVYRRPPVLHLVLGGAAAVAGLGTVVTAAFAFPTPGWGGAATAFSFLLSALAVGTVTTAMLLGHWYLVVPNLSTRPLLILLALLGAALAGSWRWGRSACCAWRATTASPARGEVLVGGASVPFWVHVGFGILLPLLVTGLALQSTRMRSLMSATGLLYVAVVLILVGQITGKVVLFTAYLPL